MPLEGKKAIHESMKNELLTFRKDQNRIQTQEIHASNDGNMVVEIGDTTLPTPQTQNQQRSFYVYLKRRTASTFASEIWDFKHAIGKNKINKKDSNKSFFITTTRISNKQRINSNHYLLLRVLKKKRYVKTSNIGASILP
jgi:hypothetical protein